MSEVRHDSTSSLQRKKPPWLKLDIPVPVPMAVPEEPLPVQVQRPGPGAKICGVVVGCAEPAAVLAERKAMLCDDRLLGKFMTSSKLPLEGDRNGGDESVLLMCRDQWM